MSLYELQEPTSWADPPSIWSSTTIEDVDACPRRWQLLRSVWGEHDRFPVRPSPAAIEGQIVHDALDRLTRACGRRGNPAIGSTEFAHALRESEFYPGFARALAEWTQQLSAHPRPGPAFRLRVRAEELANRAVRMFRAQYKPGGRPESQIAEPVLESALDLQALLRQKRALSEVKLTHPTLPFGGVLDRVQQAADGVQIVDFKTGKPSEKHHRQLLRYALLWWRATGDVPVSLSAQYLDGAASWPVTPSGLSAVEDELATKIERLTSTLNVHPAEARPGIGCGTCPVRARCDDGWAIAEAAALAEGRSDAELVATATAGPHGFVGRSHSGANVAVVYTASVGRLLPELADGEAVRILDAVWAERGSQLEIKPWSEVFVVRVPRGPFAEPARTSLASTPARLSQHGQHQEPASR